MWFRDWLLVLLGVIVTILVSPLQRINMFLYNLFIKYIPPDWSFAMGMIILVAILVAIAILLWRFDKKADRSKKKDTEKTKMLEDKVTAIIKKLQITPEEIEGSKKKED